MSLTDPSKFDPKPGEQIIRQILSHLFRAVGFVLEAALVAPVIARGSLYFLRWSCRWLCRQRSSVQCVRRVASGAGAGARAPVAYAGDPGYFHERVMLGAGSGRFPEWNR